VDEEVVSAARRCDKAIAFLVVPPFDYSLLSVAHDVLVGKGGVELYRWAFDVQLAKDGSLQESPRRTSST